jgi:hypothetical protein
VEVAVLLGEVGAEGEPEVDLPGNDAEDLGADRRQ